MTSLEQLQREFAADLTINDGCIYSSSLGTSKLPIESLLNVYRNNLRTSCQAALAADFPVIEKLVGAQFFRYLADQYARDYPQRSGDLHEFGRFMAVFLGQFGPVSSLPYIADVATLERACQVVTRAPAPQTSRSSLLRLCASGRLGEQTFGLASACLLIRSDYPIFSIWKTNQADYIGNCRVHLEEGPQSVLVLRLDNEAALWRLEEPDLTFVRSLASGHTLDSTVSKIISAGHSIDLQRLLTDYVQSGYLVISDDSH